MELRRTVGECENTPTSIGTAPATTHAHLAILLERQVADRERLGAHLQNPSRQRQHSDGAEQPISLHRPRPCSRIKSAAKAFPPIRRGHYVVADSEQGTSPGGGCEDQGPDDNQADQFTVMSSWSDMDPLPNRWVLPEALQKFLAARKKKIETDTDEWTVSIKSPPRYLSQALPPGSVLIADNGVGDHLFLTPESANSTSLSHKVHVYWHEGPEIVVLADDLDALLNPQAPTATKGPPVLYADGQTPVLVGDEVRARNFFIRRPARVVYVPDRKSVV